MLKLAGSARPTLQKFLSFIRENRLIKPNTSVLVALSGGPDSVFLLHLLNSIKDRFGLKLYAAHVNYNLRGEESLGDEKFCRMLCKRLGVPIFIKRVNLSHERSNLQHKARQIRYSFFKKIINRHQINYIATAHNLDDQVEEVLIRLIKGTSLDGLSGIKLKRGRLIRPILNFSKSEIVNFLITQKIKYRKDSSNLKPIYLRNKIRLKLIPYLKKHFNPSIKRAIFKTAINIYNDHLFIKKYSYRILNKALIDFKKNEYARLNLGKLLNKPENIRLNIYKYLLKRLSFYSENIKTNSLKSIDRLITSTKKNAFINIANNVFFIKEYSDLIVTKNIRKIDANDRVLISSLDTYELPSGARVNLVPHRGFIKTERDGGYPRDLFLSKDKVTFPLYLRRRLPGDKFMPLGMKTYVSLKDFLINRKVPMSLRNDYCVLTNEEEIIAIVGVEVSERYKVNGDEESIKVSLTPYVKRD